MRRWCMREFLPMARRAGQRCPILSEPSPIRLCARGPIWPHPTRSAAMSRRSVVALPFALLAGMLLTLPVALASANVGTAVSKPAALVAPAHGSIPVAFVVTANANVMDIAGAWEVFQDTM